MTNPKVSLSPTHTQTIDHLLQSRRSFALYRVPGQEVALMLQDEAECIEAKDQLQSGFLYAPFCESAETPTLLLRPDKQAKGWEEIERLVACMEEVSPMKSFPEKEEEEEEEYAARFERCMEAIKSGRLNKLVASQRQRGTGTNHLGDHVATCFVRALTDYPGSMVHLLYTPNSGLWLGASPELLVSRRGDVWQTMALAGTQTRGEGQWSAKNVEEQDYVSGFIHSLLVSLQAEIEHECAPHTLTTGQLEHRCTDFRFRLSEKRMSIFEMARALHPTPAVGGYPQREANAWLQNNEHLKRKYFSGYLGPVNTEGESQLYVNLRCAHITEKVTWYYAGGGLTKYSVMEDEAREIERKMDTLKNLLR